MAKQAVVTYPPQRRWISGTVSGSTTMTRPSDTTGYTSGDEISNSATQSLARPWVFANVGRLIGGMATIIRMVLITSNSASSLSPALWLYNATPTMVGDNVAFSHIAADDAVLQDLNTLSTKHVNGVGTESASVYQGSTPMFCVCAAASTSLYGVLVSGTYTPTSAQTFILRILVEN